jgi:hypothetical protein
MNDNATDVTGTVIPFKRPFYRALIDLLGRYPEMTTVDAVYALTKAVEVLRNGQQPGKPK